MEPAFGSPEEEARYWREQAKSMQAAVREAETGLQEFMESSKELEAELEADISQSSKRIAEMQAEMEGVRAQAEDCLLYTSDAADE